MGKRKGEKHSMLVTILAFLFILAFSVTIHEFGHFLIAKLFKIPVEKFSIGYGPPLIRKKIGETDFRIAYFPLGGYVKIAGEDEGEITQKNTEHTEKKSREATEEIRDVPGFYDAPIYKRVLIVLSGPLFNIVSAVFVFIAVIGIYGMLINPYMRIEVEPDTAADYAGLITRDSIVSISGLMVNDWDEASEILAAREGKTISIGLMRDRTYLEKEMLIKLDSLGIVPLVPPILGSLKLDGPAQKAGMKTGIRILQIDDVKIDSWNQMIEIVRESRNIPLRFVWEERGEIKEAEITPVPFYDPLSEDTIGQIGAVMPLERRHLPLTDVVSLSVQRSGEVLWLTLKTLYQLIVGRISRRSIGGPIAIAQLSGESARWGFENLLGLLAIISINLGLINLFPIPALDGGHVVISMIEATRKKRFSHRTRLIIQQVGYAIILLLVIFITFNDITR
ncbi:MAG: RIP metalloprotease RseP [candidate division WOR-3 bacterium]|nr:MAG: RIP metalloprotease RseP [candidate division WOR-3 bacterium]